MIVKGAVKKDYFSTIAKIVALSAVIIAFLYIGKELISKRKSSITKSIKCDAEVVEDGLFATGQYKFTNGISQSDERSYSGKYASHINAQQIYGMGYTIENPKVGHIYTISVKRWSTTPTNTFLALNSIPSDVYFQQVNEAKYKESNGWEHLEIEYIVPSINTPQKLKTFVYCGNGECDAFFDDLTISTRLAHDVDKKALKDVHVYLDNKALSKINEIRSEAINTGFLMIGDDDWVKAKMKFDDSIEYDVDLRLKGDWTDHLKGDYWSYRIKMPKDKTWNRMTTFSLQDPKTRYYLHEWLYHKALEKEDIITPRYGFINFSQNNLAPTLFAYEEHFEKQIVEYRNRREGVIVKYNDEQFWNQRLRNKATGEDDVYSNIMLQVETLPFGENKTLSNPVLKEQFITAQNLMMAHRFKLQPASEVFDMEKLAKYYAMIDVFGAHHSIIFHNQRFYFNPLLRKFEPIGFDGFTESGPYRLYANIFFGEFMSNETQDEWNQFYKDIFQDPEFNKYYVPALVKYSSDDYINQLLDENKDEYLTYEYLIKEHTKGKYNFDTNSIRQRAKKVNQNIIPHEKSSIRAYSDPISDPEIIYISNYHSLPLVILGTGATADHNNADLDKNTIVNSNPRRGQPAYVEMPKKRNHNFVFFKMEGIDKVHVCPIKKWDRPQPPVIRYSDKTQLTIPLSPSDYQVKDKVIKIHAGQYSISTPIIIPRDHTVLIEAGTTIDMVKSSYFLSYSPVKFLGLADQSIIFDSSDKTSQGIVIMNADRPSQITYTSFTNLNSLVENEWNLTGAVTLYESDVTMDHVTISHNLCEDALNIIRSQFKINALNINHTFADGFDSDFCKGSLEQSRFFATGNDGVDFSGSYVDIKNIELKNIGDKGISIGEDAQVTIENATIDGAQIGVASKDLSEVNITSVTLLNCDLGFAAYRKKPEFGGGKIIVNSFNAQSVKNLLQADSESTISLPNPQ